MAPFLWFLVRRPPEDLILQEIQPILFEKKSPAEQFPEKKTVLPGTKHQI
jgi:hypothetical protein